MLWLPGEALGSPMRTRDDIAGFLINLDRSPDRLRASARQLDDLGLSWSRVSAFDGQVADPALWSGINRGRFESNVGRPITASEIALHLSHGAAMRAFEQSSARFGVIFEDDLFIDDIAAFRDVVAALMRHCDAWDIVKLSGVHRNPLPVPLLRLREKYMLGAPLLKTTSAVAYMMNHRAAKAVLASLEPIDDHFDHRFDQPWRYALRYRVVTPFPVREQPATPSTLDYSKRAAKFALFRRRKALYYRMSIGLQRLAYNARQGFFVFSLLEIARRMG